MKPVLVVQHVAAEGPGAIGRQLAAAGFDLDIRAVWRDGDGAGELPRSLRDHSALVIMGGPMAAHSDAGFPTRSRELALARQAIAQDLPTLGVCLGAQLIAVAAGGQCYRGPVPEIGWYPIHLTPEASGDALLGDVPVSLTVFHWHGDTFSFGDLAAGSSVDSSVARPVILAESDRYRHQAFRIGQRVWGLQCHPEVNEGTVVAMVAAGREELAVLAPPDRGAGLAASIVAATPAAVSELDLTQRTIFGRFAEVVCAHSAGAESH